VLTDGTVDVVGGGIGDALNVELGQLADRLTELGVGNGELDLLLVLEGVEQRGEHGGDLAIGESGSLLEGSGGAVELLELLELEPGESGLVQISRARQGVRIVQASGALSGSSLLVDVGALQELLVFGLEQRITGRGFCEDEKSHLVGGVSGVVVKEGRGSLKLNRRDAVGGGLDDLFSLQNARQDFSFVQVLVEGPKISAAFLRLASSPLARELQHAPKHKTTNSFSIQP
jgi:hypothetical protein